jgi:hypothetical protein
MRGGIRGRVESGERSCMRLDRARLVYSPVLLLCICLPCFCSCFACIRDEILCHRSLGNWLQSTSISRLFQPSEVYRFLVRILQTSSQSPSCSCTSPDAAPVQETLASPFGPLQSLTRSCTAAKVSSTRAFDKISSTSRRFRGSKQRHHRLQNPF